ncbi:hypothetical protein Gotur_005210 [Gossypium turneri]
MWTTDQEEKATNYNLKALNVIFNGIDLQEFRTIFKYTTTHEAWTILETAHERTTSSICKVFRSLRFFMKMTIIKEAKDINTVMIDALNRSLQTFKMNLEEVRRDRLKSKKNTTLQVASSIATAEETSTEDLLKQALLIKNFNEKFKKLSRKNKGDDGGRGINRNKAKIPMLTKRALLPEIELIDQACYSDQMNLWCLLELGYRTISKQDADDWMSTKSSDRLPSN